MATAAQKFQSDEEAMAFLLGGPVVDAQLDVAPAPEFAPPEVDTPLPGVIEPNVQAVMEANGEPPLPVKEDETLPPVQPAGFATDDEALAFLQAGSERSAEPAGPTGGIFATDEEAIAFLQAGNAPADPEAKMLDLELAKKAETAPPVTTPEAADGTDVTFKKGDAPFKFTGKLVMVPGTGPTAGLEGMQPAAADGPVAAENLAGTNQAVFNRRPQLVPDGGQIVFDQSTPERFTEGVERAFESGLLPQANYEKIKANTAEIFKVVEDRRKLEAKAQQDPKLLAALQGFGRGGAMTLGAVGGAKGGALAGVAAGTALAGPVGTAIGGVTGGVVGGIGGGIAAGLGYDALYKQLGKHFEQYENVMKAAELYPQYAQGGELTMAAVALPVSVAQGARGLTTAYQAGGLPAAARMAGTAAAAGAGTGVVAYPIDAAVRGEEITPGGLATAAATGAAMGGFFINNRMATQKDLAAVAAKMKAGMKLSAAESELARAAGPAVRAEIARMDAAGGVRSGPMEVQVPVTSVAGLMPAAGRAAARVSFTVPARLPAGAMARAEAVAAGRPAGSRTAGPSVPTETMAPVPRSAPTTVLPRGDVPIPMPGPLVPATMGVDAYLAQRAEELGLTRENVNEIFELMEEHKALVVEAIDRNEPVTAEALTTYGLDVPYYEADAETGLATFNPETFKAWSEYMGGRDAEAAENVRADGIDLLDAIRELGGLPSPKSGQKKAVWSGELKTLWETSRGGRDIGVKGVMNLWRNDAKDLDDIVQGLRQRGFRMETESDLIEMLDNRIRTGRPTYGYGAISEDRMPGVLRGKAQQMDLLGEDAVEFTLQGQTDRTSLTPEEMRLRDMEAQRAQEAEKLQGDLFGGSTGVQPDPLTPPVQQRAGSAGPEVRRGTAMPRPGVARTTTTPRPDWVLQPGETSEGRRIIKGIENFKRGQKWGIRSIIDHVNRAVKLEMRRSTSQTTRKHPANYRPANKVGFTRNTQGQINFHEAGHSLYDLIEDRAPGFWKQFEAEMVPLITRDGSMASANNMHEATAEWLRLLLVDPPAVADFRVTAAMAEMAERFYPKMAAQLRDAARAVHRFQNKPAAEKLAMFNADPTQEPPTFGDFVQRAILAGRAVTNFVSSGAPVARMDRGIFRQIMKDRAEVDLGWRDALKLAREVRAETQAIQDAYNMVLNIGAETTSTISGTGPLRGVRYVGPDGKYVQLTKESWRDLRLKVPTTKLRQFDEAAWAKELLSRFDYFTARAMAARDAGDEAGMRKALQQRQYPGMMEGLTPEDLRGIVTTARQEIPRFEEYFREQSAFFDAVLNVKEFGGLKKPGEVAAMMDARDTYWPLPKVMSSSRAPRTGRTSRGDIQAGDRGIQGSGEPIRNLDEVAEERVRQAYDAFYWNRFGLTMVDRMAKVAADKRLPAEVRAMAGRESVKLIVPSEKVATLSAEEVVPWVLDAVAAKMEEVLGYKPELTPDDLNLSWSFKDVFRPGRPDDINVVSLLRNGEREFIQLGDPAAFSMIAAPQNVSRVTGLIKWALGPSLQNWKRNITQSLPFAFANMWGDIFNQTMLNPDKIGWFPGGATTLGIINKFTKKYPQVFQDGLLLSRVEPSRTELVNQVRHNAVWQWASEGFYVSTSKDPVTRVLQTALQPSNWLFPLWKTADVVNLITGGRLVAPLLETATREGAAVYRLMKGGTDEEALDAYWRVTGRFNEHAGNADVRAMMAMPGFFNPMVQAFRGAMTNLTDPDPAVSGKSWAKLLMMYPAIFGGAAIMRYLMMNEDEKERERERTLEDRLSYYDIAGVRIRFPYGPEGAMSSLTYNAVMDDLLGRPPREAERGAKLLLKRIIDPTAGPLQFLGPQLATLTEASMNWSGFRQKHIVAPWMTSLPASEQYYATTPKFYRELGAMMNYSPIKLQYVVTQGIARQVDETIRLMESIDGGRPIREDADVPFVGRMFVRNPTGMASQSVKEAGDVETKLRMLDSRLKAKGWNMLREPEFPAEKIGDRQLVQLQTQLQYLEVLRGGLRRMQDVAALSKYYTLKEDWANEANARALMTRYAQSVLVGNTDQIRVLDEAIEMLNQIPQASPEQVAEEYRQRRF